MNLIRTLKIDNFKDYLTTSAGVAIAQAIALLTVPYIANAVGPTVFGEYSYYLSLIVVLCVFSSLKLELSVFTIDASTTKTLKMFLALWVPASSFVLSMALILWLDLDSNFLILAFTLLCTFTIFFEFKQQENIKEGLFKANSLMRVYRAIFTLIYFIILHFVLGSLPETILLCFAFANLTAVLLTNNVNLKPCMIRGKEVRGLIYETRHTIVFMTPAHFLSRYSTGSMLILAGMFKSDMIQIGLFSLAYKLLIAPISIFTSANAGIVKREVIKSPQSALRNFIKIAGYSLFAGLVGVIVLVTYGEIIIITMLGKEWVAVVDYMIALTPYTLVLLVFSPITHVYVVLGKQNFDLYWQVFNAIVVTVSVVVGLKYSFITGVWLFSIAYSVSILISSAVCFLFVNRLSDECLQ